MKTRVAMVTTYNPGAAGPRYVAGHLMEHGHDVKFVHMKELRAVAVPTTDFPKHEELRAAQVDIQYVPFQHPGEVLYVPYPTPITDRELDLFIEEIRDYKPHAVGISMFSVTVNIARRLTRLLHQRLPGLPIIWGGIHCMVHPDDCLRGLTPDPDTGQANPLQVPDIVCAAEGEVPLLLLMDRWEEYQRGEIPDVPGLWFVKRTEVVRFPKLPFEKNLDAFAFPVYAVNEVLIDDNTVDHKLQDPRGFIQNHIFVFTERGCPYQCSFCIHSVINKIEDDYQRIRRRTVGHVLEEIEKRIAENGMKHFIIHDEIFAIQKKWVLEFAREWEKRFKPRGITFTGYVHPLTTDLEMVEALFRAGLTVTGIGVQTGSARTSKEVYDRPLHRQKTIQMSEYLARFPFEKVQIDLITDSPYETEDDRRETLELLLDMKPPFHVETFGLVTYSTTELVRKTRLMDEVPWNERLFWNMLYHLTGTTFLQPDTIRGLSRDPYLREHPLVLEKLVVDLTGQFFRQIKGHLHLDEKGVARPPGEASPPAGKEPAQGWDGYRFKRVLKETVKSLIGR